MNKRKDQYPLRVIGWGPFRLPGERKRLERAQREAQELVRLLKASNPTSAVEACRIASDVVANGRVVHCAKPARHEGEHSGSIPFVGTLNWEATK